MNTTWVSITRRFESLPYSIGGWPPIDCCLERRKIKRPRHREWASTYARYTSYANLVKTPSLCRCYSGEALKSAHQECLNILFKSAATQDPELSNQTTGKSNLFAPSSKTKRGHLFYLLHKLVLSCLMLVL